MRGDLVVFLLGFLIFASSIGLGMLASFSDEFPEWQDRIMTGRRIALALGLGIMFLMLGIIPLRVLGIIPPEPIKTLLCTPVAPPVATVGSLYCTPYSLPSKR